MKDRKIAKEQKKIAIIFFLIVGVLIVSGIIYALIITRTGEVDTHIERFRLCEEKGYDYMRYIKGIKANCCREILRSNDTYYLEEECIMLEIPK